MHPWLVGTRSSAGKGHDGIGDAVELIRYQTGWNWKPAEAEMLGTVLLVVLILLLIGALPTWPHSGGWGYYPSGGLGLVLIIVLILLLLGRI